MKTAAAILAVSLLFLAACGSTGSRTGNIAIPPAPAWVAPKDAREIPAREVVLRTLAALPTGVRVTHSDALYTLVSYAWLERYVAWGWEIDRAIGLGYTAQSFDCEDFALAFYVVAVRKAAQAGVKASPLIARIVVESAPGGPRHELIGVATDAGLFVVEPQPSAGPFRITPLGDYKQRILSVVFGDLNP